MSDSAFLLNRLALDVTAAIAALRAVWVINGLRNMLGMFGARQAGRRRHWDLSTALVFPEPFLLLAAVYVLRFGGELHPTAPVATVVGALLALATLVLCGWSSYVYRTVGTGHYVDDNHEVVAVGPYRIVRHPMYLGAILIWFGLAFAFQNVWTFLVAAVYVLPAYVFYLKVEEVFLESKLGDAYRTYQRRVPMILPRLPGARRRAAG